jgi:hypothetical protein
VKNTWKRKIWAWFKHVEGSTLVTLQETQHYFDWRVNTLSLCLSNPLKTEFLLNAIQKCSSYLTGNTLRLHYGDQSVIEVWVKNCCLLWEPYEMHRHTAWAEWIV